MNFPLPARLVLVVLLLVPTPAVADDAPPATVVGPVPAELRRDWKLSDSYQQYASVGGFPILASAKVSPYAVKEAAYLVDHMIGARKDLRDALIKNKIRFTVMAAGEMTTDVPEHSDLTPKQYWDRRARGLGATRERPSVSGAEENLLCLKGDPYRDENIAIHEFAHAVHLMGVNEVDKTFDKRLRAAYDAAKAAELWKDTYALSNDREYFAEGVQSWFDCNAPKRFEHNGVDTREKLRAYDPALAALCADVFGDGPWRYRRPDSPERLKAPGHLAGFDRSMAPAFAWPKELPELKRPPATTTRAAKAQGK